MNKSILKKIGIGVGGLGAALTPLLVLAQTAIPKTSISPEQIITNVTNWFAGIVLLLAICMLLYAAFMYITGGASPDAVEKAKNALIYAIIGIVVALLAYSVIPFLRGLLFGPTG